MSGSFLPSLGRNATTVYSGRGSQHCYEIKMALYLTAYKLSAEYLNRERYPLKKFAEIMSVGSLGPHWVSEGELTAIELGGKPAYRLIVHNRETPTAKGFVYVADSNGRVLMLLAVAMSDPEKLQMAVEHLKFAGAGN